MKIIKGEKYIASKGPKKGQIFELVAFGEYHFACKNLTYPNIGDELIVKYYFLEGFVPYNHLPTIKMTEIQAQQVIQKVNTNIREYVSGGVISESLFQVIANDIGRTIFREFV